MSTFGSNFRRSPAFYFDDRSERPSPDTPWKAAQRITDNRLRAMRFFIEKGDSDCGTAIDFLRSNLLVHLKQLDAQAAQYLYNDRQMSGQIQGLIQLIERLGADEWPHFASIYRFIGVDVPKLVSD